MFVPGLSDPDRIADLVTTFDAPLDILCSPRGATFPRLGDLGVRRVGLGPLLHRRALGAALETVLDIRAGRPPRGVAPDYAQVQALSARRGDSQHRSASTPGPRTAPMHRAVPVRSPSPVRGLVRPRRVRTFIGTAPRSLFGIVGRT